MLNTDRLKRGLLFSHVTPQHKEIFSNESIN